MTTKLHITFWDLYNNCLYSSLANAVLSIRNPLISYEQSWDGMNYSFQHGYSRGTITFDLSNKFLVGAFRNDISNRVNWYPKFKAVELFGEAPETAKVLSTNEALQYLFYEVAEITSNTAPVSFFSRFAGKATNTTKTTLPVATTVFWSDGDEIFCGDTYDDFISNGGEFISEIMISAKELRVYWGEQYELTIKELELVDYLIQLKKSGKVDINADSIHLINGSKSTIVNGKSMEGEKEFIKSLAEIGLKAVS